MIDEEGEKGKEMIRCERREIGYTLACIDCSTGPGILAVDLDLGG